MLPLYLVDRLLPRQGLGVVREHLPEDTFEDLLLLLVLLRAIHLAKVGLVLLERVARGEVRVVPAREGGRETRGREESESTEHR